MNPVRTRTFRPGSPPAKHPQDAPRIRHCHDGIFNNILYGDGNRAPSLGKSGEQVKRPIDFLRLALSEHWFMTMRHARSLIESWRIEYNTERRVGHFYIGANKYLLYAQTRQRGIDLNRQTFTRVIIDDIQAAKSPPVR